MSGSAIRGRQGSERFFTLPVAALIASSLVLGMSDFVVVGILPDIAHGLRVSEVTVGNLVSLFATHLTLIGVFLVGNILCALAPNYAVLPRVKGQNVCLARRVAGVRFGLFECRLSGCSRCR